MTFCVDFFLAVALYTVLSCTCYCKCTTLCKSQRSGQITTFPTPFEPKKITLCTVGSVNMGSANKWRINCCLRRESTKQSGVVVFERFPCVQIPTIL
ncbi:hypothetical protein EDB83DRAFT_2479148 [Lactarius deliciosus]|nr:hypothetical protein EDB83DRAFT_2479148 [Lactarius deliciosus]